MSQLPPKRTHKDRTPESDGKDSDSSYSDFRRDLKRARSNSPWNITDNDSADYTPLKIYVLSAKFDSAAYQSLISLVEDRSLSVGENQHSPVRRIELSANLEEADVIVTAIRTRSRLERHVNPSLAVKADSFGGVAAEQRQIRLFAPLRRLCCIARSSQGD
ncbi:hypothetical protein PISMIDRAFT_507148 [Pisolithus microcarpus 441]|uniref:Uncharacterized protein n=1 Tax=Pisolithus microcarpus 441 TaxID=765257 RepID=A0A0C9ZRM6_9AGAM|nr:hypothetical protein PISMIDRAFT_507148 [Pisolithus microcarpus 441]